ncbi:protein of unknown function [Methylocella tundrae]|uniref:Uncharacterized protein n=1 Tax=Methylocella tundrae TaxID=227605 RepID=A0A4U8YV46_METTU|nr:protein of unknown function [Methylocella tundrae]
MPHLTLALRSGSRRFSRRWRPMRRAVVRLWSWKPGLAAPQPIFCWRKCAEWRRLMVYLLVGFLIFWLSMAGLRAFTRASPAALAYVIRRGAGAAALIVAGFLVLRGGLCRCDGLCRTGLLAFEFEQAAVIALVQMAGDGGRSAGRRAGRPRVLRPISDDRNGARSRDRQDARRHSRWSGRRQGARRADAPAMRGRLRSLPSR